MMSVRLIIVILIFSVGMQVILMRPGDPPWLWLALGFGCWLGTMAVLAVSEWIAVGNIRVKR